MPPQPTGNGLPPGPRHWTAPLLILLVASLGAAAAGRQPEHTVREMRLTDGGRNVEIEVESTEPFHFGGAVSVLKIGRSEFTRSRFPADGNPRRLIFDVPAAVYDQLQDVQDMVVTHGNDGRHPDRRAVGRLDKSRLKERAR